MISNLFPPYLFLIQSSVLYCFFFIFSNAFVCDVAVLRLVFVIVSYIVAHHILFCSFHFVASYVFRRDKRNHLFTLSNVHDDDK